MILFFIYLKLSYSLSVESHIQFLEKYIEKPSKNIPTFHKSAPISPQKLPLKRINFKDLWTQSNGLSASFLIRINQLLQKNQLTFNVTGIDIAFIITPDLLSMKNWNDIKNEPISEKFIVFWNYLTKTFPKFHLWFSQSQSSSVTPLINLFQYYDQFNLPFFKEEITYIIQENWMKPTPQLFSYSHITFYPPKKCQLFAQHLLTQPHKLFENLETPDLRIHETKENEAFKILLLGVLTPNFTTNEIYPNSKRTWHSSHLSFNHHSDVSEIAFLFNSKYTQSKKNKKSNIYSGKGFITLNGALLGILVNSEALFQKVVLFFHNHPLPNKKVYIMKGSWLPVPKSCELEYGFLLEDKFYEDIIPALSQKDPLELSHYLQENSPTFQKNTLHELKKTPHKEPSLFFRSLFIYNQHFSDLFTPELQSAFKLFLCLHQIVYSPYSKNNREHSKNLQDLFNFYEEKIYFPESLLCIYFSLFEYNLIDLYLKGEYSLEFLKKVFKSQAQKAKLPLSLFFKLSVIAFLCHKEAYSISPHHFSLWESRLHSGRYLLSNPINEQKLKTLETHILRNFHHYFLNKKETAKSFLFSLSFKKENEIIRILREEMEALSNRQCKDFSKSIWNKSPLLFEEFSLENFKTYSTCPAEGFQILLSGRFQPSLISPSQESPTKSSTNHFFIPQIILLIDSTYTQHDTFNTSGRYNKKGFMSLNGALLGVIVNSDSLFRQVVLFFNKHPIPNKKVHILKGTFQNSFQIQTCHFEYGLSFSNFNHENIIPILNNEDSLSLIKYFKKKFLSLRPYHQQLHQNTEPCLSLYDQHFQDLFPTEFQAALKLFLCLYTIAKVDGIFKDTEDKSKIILNFHKETPYFPESLLNIFLVLLEKDLISDYFKEEKTLESFQQDLLIQAQKAQWSPSLFLKVHLICFLCKKESSSSIQNEFSLSNKKQKSGRYMLKNKEFEKKLQLLETHILGANPQYSFSIDEQREGFLFCLTLKDEFQKNQTKKFQSFQRDIHNLSVMKPKELAIYIETNTKLTEILKKEHFCVNRSLADYSQGIGPILSTSGESRSFSDILIQSLKKGKAWLDSGAGECCAILNVLEKHPNAIITGLTLNKTMKEILFKRLFQDHPNFTLISENILNFEVILSTHPSQKFEIITDIYGPLSYVNDFSRILNIYTRSLNIGGQIIFCIQKSSLLISEKILSFKKTEIISNETLISFLKQTNCFKVHTYLHPKAYRGLSHIFVLTKIAEPSNSFTDLFLVSIISGQPPQRIYHSPPITIKFA